MLRVFVYANLNCEIYVKVLTLNIKENIIVLVQIVQLYFFAGSNLRGKKYASFFAKNRRNL